MRSASLAVLVLLVTALGIFAVARWGGDAQAASPDAELVSVGDTVRVEGVPVGCRVTRLASFGNRVFLDCRRAGRLAGTYGTYFGEQDVLVVKFVGPRKAKTVLRVRHAGEVDRCT